MEILRLAGLPKEKLRTKFRSLAERPEGRGKETAGPPKSWIVAELGTGEKPEGVAIDEALARGGRRSARVGASSKGIYASERTAVQAGRKLKVSFWILTDRADKIQPTMLFVSATDASTGIVPIAVTGDTPWWTRVEVEVDVPANTSFFRFSLSQKFPEGKVWLDEVSVRSDDGTDLLANGGFEER